VICISEAAAKLGISNVRVQQLCRQGRIIGAQKVGRAWVLPDVPVILPPSSNRGPSKWRTK